MNLSAGRSGSGAQGHEGTGHFETLGIAANADECRLRMRGDGTANFGSWLAKWMQGRRGAVEIFGRRGGMVIGFRSWELNPSPLFQAGESVKDDGEG